MSYYSKKYLVSLSTFVLLGSIALGSLLTPKTAHADFIGLWLKPKVDYIAGTGEVFKRFEGVPGYGLEAGVELLGLSIWGDYQMMGNEQFWASGNVGIDFSFGSDIELTVGGYGGLVWFGFPTQESSNNGLMFNSDEEELLSMAGVNLNDLTSEYQEFVSAEEKIANSAFGLVGRARLSLEYHIIPLISVGVQGTAGYHFVLSGEHRD
jgi:hypothetical protein